MSKRYQMDVHKCYKDSNQAINVQKEFGELISFGNRKGQGGEGIRAQQR